MPNPLPAGITATKTVAVTVSSDDYVVKGNAEVATLIIKDSEGISNSSGVLDLPKAKVKELIAVLNTYLAISK